MKNAFLIDVDGTLYYWDKVINQEVLRHNFIVFLQWLKSIDVDLYCWSAGGAEYAKAFTTKHGIDNLFLAFFYKKDIIKVKETLKKYDQIITIDDEYLFDGERQCVNLMVYKTD